MARRSPIRFVVATALVVATAASARGADDVERPPAAGRVFWLRADLGVTKGLSDLVTAWNDAATATPLLANVYANSLPEWRAAEVGGQPALHFDGNDFLYGGGMPTGSYTKVAVCALDDVAPANNVFSGFYEHALYFGGSDRARLFHFDGTNGGDFATSARAVVAREPVVLVATYDASTGNGTIFQDGFAVGHGNDGKLGNGDSTVLLGSYGFGNFLQGSIAEVLAYDRVLDGRELVELQQYLLRRHHGDAPRVHVARMPASGQVLQRDANDEAAAVVRGEVASEGYDAAVLEIARDGDVVDTRRHALNYVNGRAPFAFAPKLPSGLHDHVVSLYLERGVARRLVARAGNVCVGDVWLVNGQSNAAAGDYWGEQRANADCQGRWVRSFGTASVWGDVGQDLHWDVADGETYLWHASVGQWAIRLGQVLAHRHGVPIGLINGAVGGTSITLHQRDPNDPMNLDTIYGRMLFRATQAEVAASAKAMLWYQGESDGDDAVTWYSNWQSLRAAWALDFPALQHVYLFQIRDDCGGGGQPVREIQRELIDLEPDVSVMSTTAAPAHDGCHFQYLGYRELGERMARLLGRDFYGSLDKKEIDAPNVLAARWKGTFHRRIELEFRDPNDVLVFEPGAELDFFTDDGVAVTGANVNGNKVVLILAAPSTATTLSYNGHPLDGPWLKNARGVGALTFFGVAIQ
jgi:hypothetical protein